MQRESSLEPVRNASLPYALPPQRRTRRKRSAYLQDYVTASVQSAHQAVDGANKTGLCFVALIFPMIPVYIIRGRGGDLYLNILLWLMGLFPGVIHGIYIIIDAPTQSHAQGQVERKYDIASTSVDPELAQGQGQGQGESGSRDGTEVRPFSSDAAGSPSTEQPRGQLPTYDSVAGSWAASGQRSPSAAAARGDKKGH